MNWFTDNKTAWLLLLFIGVLYWAFRSRLTNRYRRPPRDDEKDNS